MDKVDKKVLNDGDYKKILQSKYKTEEKNIEIKSAAWEPLSEDIEGFMGDHYILKLEFKLHNEDYSDTFFIKTKPKKTEIQRQMTSEFNSYEKEIFLYDHLQKEFQKLGYETNFAPWSYYCTNEDTLVMENLKSQGFKLLARNTFFDVDHCKAALKSMATYHGNSISYEEKMSRDFGKTYRIFEGRENIFRENLYIMGDKSGLGFQFCDKSIKCFLKIIDLLPKSEKWKNSFEKKVKSFDAAEVLEKKLPYRKTCGHGDLWSNNMLFQYSSNGTPVHCKLVDFQLLRYYYPCFDPLLILYENTRRDFRLKNMSMLLNFYYDSLSSVVSKNGFDITKIISRSDFFESVEHVKILSIFQGAAVRTMILLPTETLNSAVESGGDDLKDIIFSDSRADLVYKYVQINQEFRNIIFDDAYDLYENL